VQAQSLFCGPNKALELTGKTLAHFARSSPPALGAIVMELHSKIASWAAIATGAAIFYCVVLLAPFLANVSWLGKASSGVVAALGSFAIYRLILMAFLWVFGKSQWIRKKILGDGFLEGTWVGHYELNGLHRYTIETISQRNADTRVIGREFDHNGATRAEWSSEAAFVDLRRERLMYVYSCDVYGRPHQQYGLGVFKLVKSAANRPPDRLDGYAVDMIDGQKDPNTEHKISDQIVTTKKALAKARSIFGP
jgi:hypothetical protein